jgi:hypothetical protein
MDERWLRHDGRLKIQELILALPEAHDFLIGCNKAVAYPLEICHSNSRSSVHFCRAGFARRIKPVLSLL